MLSQSRIGARKSARVSKPAQRVNNNPGNFESEASETDDADYSVTPHVGLPKLLSEGDCSSSDSHVPLSVVKAKKKKLSAGKRKAACRCCCRRPPTPSYKAACPTL